MADEFSVPSWIQPPSPAQKEELDLQRQAQHDREAVMLQQSFDRAQRRAVVARMQGDVNASIASGADPMEARARTLYNYAPQLFRDNPEMADEVQTKIETGIRRRQAMQKYRSDLAELTAKQNEDGSPMYTQEDAMAKALSQNLDMVDGNPAAQSALLWHTQQNLSRESLATRNMAGRMEQIEKEIQGRKDVEGIRQEGANKRAELKAESQAPRLSALKSADKAALTAHLKKLDEQESADYQAFMDNKADATLRKKLSDTWTAIYDTREALRKLDAKPNVSNQVAPVTPKGQSASKRLRWTPQGLVPVE